MTKKIHTGLVSGSMGKVSSSELRADIGAEVQSKKQRTSSGAASMALGVARVVTVNSEEHTVTLRVVLGADQEFTRSPVTITYPGAGARHFFGAMPEVGSHCVIGHLAQETDGRSTTPVIIAWIPQGTWLGHDWMVSQPFAPDELSMDPKDSFFVAGQYQRTRHKLRHMDPGNVVASSAQGSDVVLTEEVLITNRRCNEIRLRDQDQAFVVRAQQHFGAFGGTRTYSGMVQRDATLLPSQMVYDGTDWDSGNQWHQGENRPLTDAEMKSGAPSQPLDSLNPHPVFKKTGDKRDSGIFFEPNVDPYDFLERSGLLKGGLAADSLVKGNATYGGKTYHRVSALFDSDGRPLNAAIGNSLQSRAYTEHRVEISHTWDGRLPVSEQTDEFDADRLPRANGSPPPNQPFIESVLGTVVGNDPYTPEGRKQYGIPISPRIFDDSGRPSPSLESASDKPEGEQAATLLRITPPTIGGDVASWSSWTKDGRFRAAVQGPASEEYSAEIHARSGIRVSMGGVLRLETAGGLELKTNSGGNDNLGLDLSSSNGAVRIYGGGNQSPSAGTFSAPVGGAESDLPSVTVEGRDNVSVKSSRRILLNSGTVDVRSGSTSVAAMSSFSVNAGDRVGISSKTFDQVVNGKMTVNIHGPKDNLPTNAPFRSTTITGVGVGVVDEYTLLQGDRSETLLLGNHSTQVAVGNLTYETLLGQFTARATPNQMVLDSVSGMNTQVLVGNVQMDAVAGATSISGQVAVTVRSSGPAVLSGASGVTLGGPGKVGGIVSSSDLDPLTGLPLATFGMGSPGHILGPPV